MRDWMRRLSAWFWRMVDEADGPMGPGTFTGVAHR